MTKDVRMANPNQPISAAAKMMAECDCGALPVADGDKLAGMITDRDIAVRAVAKGKGPETPIREVMSEGICYCFEDQDISEVAANMADIQVRRLPSLAATSASLASYRSATSPYAKAKRKTARRR